MLTLTKENTMSKNNKVTKIAGILHTQKVASAFRVGSRKLGKSAHAMSSDALLSVLADKSQSKFHKSAADVLSLRGVDLTA